MSVIHRYIEKIRHVKIIKRLKHMGVGAYIDVTTELYYPENISIGDYVHFEKGCRLFGGGEIEIGSGTIFSHDVEILTQNHNYNSSDLMYIPYDKRNISKKVIIGEYCWIGARVIILPGVVIGKGAVVGAGSVVAKDIPDYAVAAGNPAHIIKYRDPERFTELYTQNSGYIKLCKNNG